MREILKTSRPNPAREMLKTSWIDVVGRLPLWSFNLTDLT